VSPRVSQACAILNGLLAVHYVARAEWTWAVLMTAYGLLNLACWRLTIR
jgi:hypothetical protein